MRPGVPPATSYRESLDENAIMEYLLAHRYAQIWRGARITHVGTGYNGRDTYGCVPRFMSQVCL